jgi:hypothetical protein
MLMYSRCSDSCICASEGLDTGYEDVLIAELSIARFCGVLVLFMVRPVAGSLRMVRTEVRKS